MPIFKIGFIFLKYSLTKIKMFGRKNYNTAAENLQYFLRHFLLHIFL